ncbi:class I SAM-dependent methyltransferase [Caulobacter soli]|uniref:class I SAM-dependent methyltransferase n=1 Tax=Caulobacter soli TaxID=2708539 RepID=UPI0013EAD304|nr:class I SAM-dependent methyltransferase [Caulobacter soli]
MIEAKTLTQVGDLVGLDERQVFTAVLANHPLYTYAVQLRIWASADRLIGRNVVELGCGPGLLGKHIGFIVDQYLGIDVSRLALALARGGAHANCRFVHINDHEELEPCAGAYDTVVGREFFIHQNYDSARDLLGLAEYLLLSGGTVHCDFFARGDGEAGQVYEAHAERDAEQVSSGYSFSQSDVEDVAGEAGLEVLSQTLDTKEWRRFVVLRKP